MGEEFWAVGSSFGGVRDQTKDFLIKGYWQDGWGKSDDNRNQEILSLIKTGDYLLMKSSSTKGADHSISFTKLKAHNKILLFGRPV